MAVSRAMRRLLRVLQLEEEHRQMALETALGELQRLERALEATAERERGGRRLIAESAASGDGTDRVAGLEEGRSATRRAAALRPWIQDAGEEVAALSEAYLAKRIERRQAETLLQKAEAAGSREANRRNQQALDDWYLSRLQRSAAVAKPVQSRAFSEISKPEGPEPLGAPCENLSENPRGSAGRS